ncbi:MAG: AMP-dependent synthetase/ligase [Spirochaetia bacterium]
MIDAKLTVPKAMKAIVEVYPDEDALHSKNESGTYQVLTFGGLWERVRALGTVFLDMGIKRGDHVGLMSDNRPEWIIIDLALLSIGAADVPRGSDSTAQEMAYILNHADCRRTFAENEAQLEKILSLKKEIPNLKEIIVIDPAFNEGKKKRTGVTVIPFKELMEKSGGLVAKNPDLFKEELEKGQADDLATLLYTSGTTGDPKGVMLTHRSFLFQLEKIKVKLFLDPSDIFLTVLPIWHSFERAVEYICMSYGSAIAYSKPIGQVMMDDMSVIRPTYMTSVPRIWEGVRSAVYRNINKQSGVKRGLFHFFMGVGKSHATLFNLFLGRYPRFKSRSRVVDSVLSAIPLLLLTPLKALGNVLVFKKLKNKLGGRFKAGISGGGALPPYVDKFFQAAGIKLLEGYGLTETAPVIAVRNEKKPEIGTVGSPLEEIQWKVLGEDGKELSPGRKGVLHVKSEQIMQGYYKKPEETEKVLRDGWLNTGDLVVMSKGNELKIVGRVKETIVLIGGENVEPAPIEEKILQSEFIDQVMVVGQDQRYLGALVVPNEELIVNYAKDKGIPYTDYEELLDNPVILNAVNSELQSLINPKTGFKGFERIVRFALLKNHFEVGEELTQTLKMRRNIITAKYKKVIANLFK